VAWLDPRDFHQKDVPEVEQLMSDQRRAYDTVLNYCINFETHQKGGQGFGLFGDVGTAKTHLLAAAVNYLLERKIQAVHVNTLEILEEIRSTYETDDQGKPIKEIRASEIVNLIKTCEYLSLDDVGAEKSTDWVQEKFYEILNHRYENEMPTVFSTNYTLEELRLHLGRAYRRLVEPCLGRMAVIKGTSYDQLVIRKKR
jgi:DNA replication protein DnaC